MINEDRHSHVCTKLAFDRVNEIRLQSDKLMQTLNDVLVDAHQGELVDNARQVRAEIRAQGGDHLQDHFQQVRIDLRPVFAAKKNSHVHTWSS